MKSFKECLNLNKEFGIVEKLSDTLVFASGLPNVSLNETVVFESGDLGIVSGLDESFVEVNLLTRAKLKPGLKCARTGDLLKIPVSKNLLGKTVDPVCRLLNGESIEFEAELDFDSVPQSIKNRRKIIKQLETGVAAIDTMIPLGMGQRELVVGDRKTGKTSMIMSIIKKQIELGTIVVYALIGKERAEVKKLLDFLEEEKLVSRTIIITASADEPVSLIDLAPYTAMTIAEYFMNAGENVLLVLDDLTTHAKAYRELALTGKRFPGRDSYPGDIFYKHARLLERAGCYDVSGKSVSITCLPLAESFDGRLTDYIVSNLISITDGHMLFDVESFNKGLRPALNLFLSVTRVGKQTQSNIARSLNRKIFRLLSSYASVESYKHFGTELSSDLKKILDKGNKIYKFFEQPTHIIIPKEAQAIFLTMLWQGSFDSFEDLEIIQLRNAFLKNYMEKPEAIKIAQELFGMSSYELYMEKFKPHELFFKSLCRI